MPQTAFDPLHLDVQTCFPLYAASRLITRLYQPLLNRLDITYPQYLVMLLLWQHKSLTVSAIGEQTYLESNTLSPLLKKLEAKRLIERTRSDVDERVVHVSLTPSGRAMRKRAEPIPVELFEQIGFPLNEMIQLKGLLGKLLLHLSAASDAEAPLKRTKLKRGS